MTSGLRSSLASAGPRTSFTSSGLEAGGARTADILKLTIWVATPDARAAINGPWVEMFPDAPARPARHILNYDLPGGMLMQCEALAVLEG